ncbi:MAG: O-antigen ligase family protein [Planctomycetota bacterium]
MTRRRHKTARSTKDTPSGESAPGEVARHGNQRLPTNSSARTRPEPLLERVALLVLLSLIPLRAIIGETHTFELLRWLRNIDAPPTPSPATTLGISSLILAVAVVLLFARWLRRDIGYRRTGAELGLGLLLIAAVVSTWNAGQKHLALVGVSDFLGLVLYVFLLRQLLTRPWHVRLAIAVVLATGTVVVAKCAYQFAYEIPDTIEYYEAHKAELADTDTAEESDFGRAGFRYDYEQRLRARSLSGYFRHPNVLAGYLILVVMTALAVAAGRFRRRPRWTLAAPLLLAGFAFVALVLAQSKGGVAACCIGLVLWPVGQWIAGRDPRAFIRKRLVVLLWLSALVGTGAVVAVLHSSSHALGRSMLFRSLYWQGAGAMFANEGPWGVGANNFGRLFTRYKTVQCPEEVDDPHSFVVKVATEWGVVGLAGVLLLFVGYSVRLSREPVMSKPRDGPSGSIILWAAGIGVVVFGWWLCLLAGASPAYLVWTILVAIFPWVIGFIALSYEDRRTTAFADDAPGPMLACICGGLIGFLLHAGIDLTLFHPGAATTFFALMAVALAIRSHSREGTPQPISTCGETANGGSACALSSTRNTGETPVPQRCPVVLAGCILGAVGLVLFLVFVVAPAAGLGGELRVARLNSQAQSWDAYVASRGYRAYGEAIGWNHLDGTAAAELVEELAKRVATVEQVDSVLDEFVSELRRCDPLNDKADYYSAVLYSHRCRLGGDPADLARAAAAMRASIAAYPTSPKKRLILADIYEAMAQATGSLKARHNAAIELQEALNLDAQREYVSKPHRLTEEQRGRISARIAALTQNRNSGPRP